MKNFKILHQTSDGTWALTLSYWDEFRMSYEQAKTIAETIKFNFMEKRIVVVSEEDLLKATKDENYTFEREEITIIDSKGNKVS